MNEWLSGEQGWRSGESTRLPPMCPGPGVICGLSLLLVFVLCSGFSLSSASKTNTSKFQFNLRGVPS